MVVSSRSPRTVLQAGSQSLLAAGLTLASSWPDRSLPVFQTIFLPASCLLPLRFLFAVVHPSCPSETVDVFESALSETYACAGPPSFPAAIDLVVAGCCLPPWEQCRCICGPPHLKQPFCCLVDLCPTFYSTYCKSIVCWVTASAIALRLTSSAEGWTGSSVCYTGMARGVCSDPLTARYSSMACTASLMVVGATASKCH